MMNTQLEKLLKKHNFSLKDRHDFLQIFSLLPNHKKVTVVENFEDIVRDLEFLWEDLRWQQDVLFGDALENIESKLEKIQKSRVVTHTQQDISVLKKSL